jgi:hypothetical protein
VNPGPATLIIHSVKISTWVYKNIHEQTICTTYVYRTIRGRPCAFFASRTTAPPRSIDASPRP